MAAEDSRFWLPFVKRGFTPDSGATWLLPRLVGVARAKELLLLGTTGQRRRRRGLGNDPPRRSRALSFGPRSMHWSTSSRAGATVAVGLTKHCVNGALDGSLAGAMESEAMALELSSRSGDFREGLSAFRERREPTFEGR